jgi:hypothetical protein
MTRFMIAMLNKPTHACLPVPDTKSTRLSIGDRSPEAAVTVRDWVLGQGGAYLCPLTGFTLRHFTHAPTVIECTFRGR